MTVLIFLLSIAIYLCPGFMKNLLIDLHENILSMIGIFLSLLLCNDEMHLFCMMCIEFFKDNAFVGIHPVSTIAFECFSIASYDDADFVILVNNIF